ncbi:Anti-sigma regulatory factor (Ser/Thr protein kinase) [Streptomyces sp. OK228]|nr:Anti-sigma regulatory factor (Ser/Thr protein kinase) [Streptomyces sp. OK228]
MPRLVALPGRVGMTPFPCGNRVRKPPGRGNIGVTVEDFTGYEPLCSSVRTRNVRTYRHPRENHMIERLDGAVIPTGFDVPVEPLRRAAHYTGEPGCIAEARHFAELFLEQLRSEWCAEIGAQATGDLLLVVSELVTNADRHSHGPYILELEGTDTSVTVIVYDSSAALPRRYPRDPGRVGRHGLEIVHALATEVTVGRVPVGKCVKARLALHR